MYLPIPIIEEVGFRRITRKLNLVVKESLVFQGLEFPI
jgi:hypothetical protein